MPKKRRVPLVLWRLFRDRVRTLATTILSLTSPHKPPPSQSCLCKTQLCLNCCGSSDNALSFLLRSDDPAAYRKLLNQCFVVVDDNAPPFGASEFHSWSQHEIVVRVIEMMIREQSPCVNILCSGYDKFNHSSPIVELLTSSAWALLLNRVGDSVMIYLLKHTSIFLPFPPKKHHQVTGFPVSDLAFKLTKHAAQPQCQDSSVISFGNRKKRGLIGNANPRVYIQQHSTSSVQVYSSCSRCNERKYMKPSRRHPPNKYDRTNVSKTTSQMLGADFTEYEELPNGDLMNQRKRSRPFRWRQSKKCKHSDNDESSHIRAFNRSPVNRYGHANILEAVSSTIGTCTVKHGGFSDEEHKGLNLFVEKPKKRSRLFGWLRRRKYRVLDDETACDKTCCIMDATEEDSALWSLQCDRNDRKYHFNKKLCSCCHVLQASHLVTKGAQINRQPIFYNLKQYSSVLPQDHMLYSLKPNFVGSKSLACSIFGLSNGTVNSSLDQCSHSSNFCLIGSGCLFHSLIKSLKILIRRSHHCKHVRLLDKHCMVSSLTHMSNKEFSGLASEANDSDREVSKKSYDVNAEHFITPMKNREQTEGVKSYCSKNQVVSYIWAVCRNLVPPDLLGTPSNWRILTRNIARFIQLRRFEKFSLKQCVHNLKVSEFPFLSDKHSFCSTATLNDMPENDAVSDLKHVLLEKWIFWLFQYLVVPLLQTHFYVTESDHCKQDIFYYRKSIWQKLKNKTIASLKDQNYHCLSPSDVDSIISNRLFGFSKLRLCPKENGVRMLANLKAPSRMLDRECFSSKGTLGKPQVCRKSLKYKHFKSVNSVLRDTYAVLKGIQLKEPEKLGSSVFDYNDIYGKLCPFISGLKNGANTMPNVFIVVSDVSKAFDSIDQDKLLRVMKDVIVEDEYLLQQSSQIVSTKKSFWVNQNLILADPNLSYGFTKFGSARFGSLHSVLVNQGLSRNIKKKELFFNLSEHVKHNILQFDKAFYLQGIGIPQGSILSSLLCSLYYGHLERNVVFPFLGKTCKATIEDLSARHNSQGTFAAGISSEDRVIPSSFYMLLRLIDDFCFISTSKEQAASFYTRVQRGFRDYNCYMNEKKYCINFDSGHASVLPSSRGYVGEDGILFIRWSGLLLNSCTLEVQADYTRYLNSHLRSTLTISWQGKPAHRLKAKLRGYMRPKCHPIFFDSNINSGPVVRLNIYQSFLLCAMKFHCYVSEMLYMCKLRPRFYLEIIARSFRYMYMLIKKMMYSGRSSSRLRPVLKLEADEVEWLGLNAFIKVLKRKQSRHEKLLGMLKLKLLVHKISGSNVSSELKYAVDSSHSSVMWKIKY